MKPSLKQKDFETVEGYEEYIENFDYIVDFYSREGYARFCRDQRPNMYEPSEASTYKKWLEYERCFTNMGEFGYIENEIIDRILERLEKKQKKVRKNDR
ncbi:MAG: hypothetical protein GTO02_22360 [Candidatus Dadabacteria bacterium]|nr:hypothetical protein [Candidatus Dadabacteria bacterium]